MSHKERKPFIQIVKNARVSFEDKKNGKMVSYYVIDAENIRMKQNLLQTEIEIAQEMEERVFAGFAILLGKKNIIEIYQMSRN